MPSIDLVAALVVFFSDISSSTTGIGIGIISTSYFSLIYSPQDAVLLGLFVFMFSNITILLQYRRHIDKKFLVGFIPLTIPGIIAGTLSLKYLDPQIIRTVFGILLLLIVIFTINGNVSARFLREARSQMLFAAIIGFTSAFMNASSPFMVIMLLSLGYTNKGLVATATAGYLLNNLMKLISFSSVGIFSPNIAKMSMYFIPFIILGVLTGRVLIEKIPASALRKAILSLLCLFAFAMILGY